MNKNNNSHLKSDSQSDLDLDINNYNLDDILELFKIPKDFNETDLKKAKQIVLKTHPDKSQLDPDYFRFYSKAYKMLFTVWEFRKKGDVDIDIQNKNTDYSYIHGYKDRKKMLDNFLKSSDTNTDTDTDTKTNKKFNSSKDFNNWFNKEFNKYSITSESESKGYQSWLTSNEGIDSTLDKNVSMSTLAQEFEKKKKEARSLILHRDVEDIFSSNSGFILDTNAPSSFDSDMFSTLPYQDLYKAHTENVIPVTDEDYNSREKFNNVNEYISHRNNQNMKPLSEQQSEQYFNNRSKKEEEMAASRAYQLARQTELANQKSQEFWAGIQFIENRK